MKRDIKVSVITVCYNAEATLAQTISSVISQTYGNMEYIVIDGNSSDSTTDIIRQYESRISYWVSEPDTGIYDAMNKGTKQSHGDYILFMNSGDTFFNDNVLHDVIEYVSSHASAMPDIIYGETIGKMAEGEYLHLPISKTVFQNDIGCCHQSILANGNLMRREGFNTAFKVRADFDFLHRAYLDKRNSFMHVPRFISVYDYFGFSASIKNRRYLDEERALITGEEFSVVRFYCRVAKIYVKKQIAKLLPASLKYRFSYRLSTPQPLDKFVQMTDTTD